MGKLPRRSENPSPPRISAGQVQAAHGAGGRGEFVRLEPHTMEHGNEQIRQWIIVTGIEGEMLSVFETAAGEQDGHIGRDVGVGVPQIGSVKDHGAIEQRFAFFGYGFEVSEQFGEQFHMPFIDGFELGELLG